MGAKHKQFKLGWLERQTHSCLNVIKKKIKKCMKISRLSHWLWLELCHTFLNAAKLKLVLDRQINHTPPKTLKFTYKKGKKNHLFNQCFYKLHSLEYHFYKLFFCKNEVSEAWTSTHSDYYYEKPVLRSKVQAKGSSYKNHRGSSETVKKLSWK